MSRNGAPIRKLDRLAMVKLVDWMRSNAASIQETRPTLKQLAERAGKELGLSVSPSSCAELRDALGIHWERPKAKRRAGRKRLDELTARVEALEAQVAKLLPLLD